MIKIFGKIRYHFQPDLMTSIIYWSITFMVLFLSLIFTLENTAIYITTFVIFFLFILMLIIGFHRYFYITEFEELFVVCLSFKNRTEIPISTITEIHATHTSIAIFSTRWEEERVFSMRTSHREPFLEKIKSCKTFSGKIIEVDHIEEI